MFCLMREVHKRRMTDNKVLRRRGRGGAGVLGNLCNHQSDFLNRVNGDR